MPLVSHNGSASNREGQANCSTQWGGACERMRAGVTQIYMGQCMGMMHWSLNILVHLLKHDRVSGEDGICGP